MVGIHFLLPEMAPHKLGKNRKAAYGFLGAPAAQLRPCCLGHQVRALEQHEIWQVGYRKQQPNLFKNSS